MREENPFLTSTKPKNNRLSQFAAFALIISMALSLCAFSEIAFGQTLVKSYAFVFATPQTIPYPGTVYIVGWIQPPHPNPKSIYHNYTFTITKPDGSKDIRFFDESDSAATRSFSYGCDQQGTYSVILSWPGEAGRGPSISPPATWIAQQGYVVPTTPNVPVVSGNWQFPISAEDYESYQVSGGWLASGQAFSYNSSCTNFNPYSTGPNTPHVLWRDPRSFGGIVGGGEGYLAGAALGYPQFSVAAQGKIWYVRSFGTGSTLHPRLYCFDLFTGQQIYAVDLPTDPTKPGAGGDIQLEFRGVLKGDPNLGEGVAGAYSVWISGSGLWEVDAMTGNTLYYMPAWNGSTSISIAQYADDGPYTRGALYLKNYPSLGNVTKFDTRSKKALWTINPFDTYSEPPYWDTALFLTGDLLVQGPFEHGRRSSSVIRSWSADTGQLMLSGTDVGNLTAGAGVVMYGKVYFPCRGDMKVRAIDLSTGRVAWTSEPMQYPWGAFTAYGASAAYGKVYMNSYDGYLYCFDAYTGKTVWKYYSGSTTDNAFGTYPWWGTAIIADGKVYAATGEHTPPDPEPRGYTMYCLDANNGNLIWKLPGFYGVSRGANGIANGVLWYYNRYDGCMYMFGKGQSATTITAQNPVVSLGGSVLLQGTVTDQSSGSKGTPAISDASMSDWTGYLYMNKPMPSNATGVTVVLRAVNVDTGAVSDVGRTTSDLLGTYQFAWNPSAKGTYKILASFEGSDSYYSSSAEASAVVVPAAIVPVVSPTIAPTVAPTVPPVTFAPTASPSASPIVEQAVAPLMLIVAIAAIVVITIAAVVALARRRKK